MGQVDAIGLTDKPVTCASMMSLPFYLALFGNEAFTLI